MSKIKLKIKELRIEQNLTQEELAELSGLDQSYISVLENNHRKKSPTLKILESIATALNVCVFRLMECNDGYSFKCDSNNCIYNKSMSD